MDQLENYIIRFPTALAARGMRLGTEEMGFLVETEASAPRNVGTKWNLAVCIS